MNLSDLQRQLLGKSFAFEHDSELWLGLSFSVIKQLLLESALLQVEFREEWYLHIYPDVAAQVTAGNFISGLDHFIKQGFWSGRLGRPMSVDVTWYTNFYGDVGRAVATNNLANVAEHFEKFGFLEGRAASESVLVDRGWYKQKYPDADLEVRIGKYPTLQHYFNFEGFSRGHQANNKSSARQG